MAHSIGALRQHHHHPRVPFTERLKGAMGFFGFHVGEEPHYEVLFHEGAREIRQYRPLLLARVTVPGDFQHASQRAFHRLADYLFGRNLGRKQLIQYDPSFKEKTKRHTKVPFWQEKLEGGWRMCFVLPSGIRQHDAPAPFDRGIEIYSAPAHTVACLTYNGKNHPERIAQKVKSLRAWIESHNGKPLNEEFRVAQYEPPFRPPFFQKSELHIPLQKKDKNRTWEIHRVKGNALL